MYTRCGCRCDYQRNRARAGVALNSRSISPSPTSAPNACSTCGAGCAPLAANSPAANSTYPPAQINTNLSISEMNLAINAPLPAVLSRPINRPPRFSRPRRHSVLYAHHQPSTSSNSSSTFIPKMRASRNARVTDGSAFPRSIAWIAWRLTPARLASSSCVRSSLARCIFTRLASFTLSNSLALLYQAYFTP